MPTKYKNNKTVALSKQTKDEIDKIINQKDFSTADEAIAFLLQENLKLKQMRMDMYKLDEFTGGEIFHFLNNIKQVEYSHNNHQYIFSILNSFNEVFEKLYITNPEKTKQYIYLREKLPKAIYQTLDILLDDINEVQYDEDIEQMPKDEWLKMKHEDKIYALGNFLKAFKCLCEAENKTKLIEEAKQFAGLK